MLALPSFNARAAENGVTDEQILAAEADVLAAFAGQGDARTVTLRTR